MYLAAAPPPVVRTHQVTQLPAPTLEIRDVVRKVLAEVMDATRGAFVSTLETPKFDTSQPYWVNRASRYIGVAQGAMGAAISLLPLVPGIALTPMIVTGPLDAAQAAIGAAVDLPLGSQERRAQIAVAHAKLKTAGQQLEYAIRSNWPDVT